MKSILVVSHYYEPFSLVGAKRITYFTSYFREKGLKALVLKANNKYYGENVSKTKSIDIDTISLEPNEFILKISTSLAWYFAYKIAIKKIIESQEIDVLFLNGGPFYYFLLGFYYYKKFALPYVLDFRDPWHRSDIYYKSLKGKIANIFSYICEYIAVSQARLVINVTESLTFEYRKKYLKFDDGRFITIFNGYNETELAILTTLNIKISSDALNLGIFGKFTYYNNEHMKWLLKAIKNLQPIIQKKIMIYYLGQENDIEKEAESYNLCDNVNHLGYVEYCDGIGLLSKMDALILNNRYEKNLGTKIFDYIYINKPIIAFTKPCSEISNLVNRFSAGHSVSSQAELEKILQLINNMDSRVLDKEDKSWGYSRRFQAEKLFRYISSISY